VARSRPGPSAGNRQVRGRVRSEGSNLFPMMESSARPQRRTDASSPSLTDPAPAPGEIANDSCPARGRLLVARAQPHDCSSRVLTRTDPAATPRGASYSPGREERQTAEVASCLWSEPTLTSIRRGFACSATGMATVNTPPS
jgi:hypothetical protein